MTNQLRVCFYLLVFFTVFNFTSSIMSSGYTVGTLGGSNEISTYSVTFFGLGNACTFPIGNELGRRFGVLQILFFFLIFFCITLYLCGAAPNYLFFVLSRFLSGVASGVFFPLCIGKINEHVSKEQHHSIFAFLGLLITVTPVIAACFGGWVAYDLEWQWIFYSQIPILVIVGYIIYIHKTPHIMEQVIPFNKTGYFFYLISSGATVTGISLGEQLDWFRSPLISSLLVIAVICLIFFILWEWDHKNPIFDLQLFKIPVFFLCILCLVALFSAYFGMVLMLSLWLRIVANYTPIWISLIIVHMALAGTLLFIFLKKWLQQVASLWVVLIAVFFFAYSCFYSSGFNVEVDFKRLAIARTLSGFGLAFFLFPLLHICLNSVDKTKVTQGFILFQSSRLLAGSLGCAVYTTIWFRRRIFYHDRLVEQLTPYSKLTRQFFEKVSFYVTPGLESNQLLEKALSEQSDVLAIADCFYLMGWVMVGIALIISSHLILTYFKKSPDLITSSEES